MLTSASVPVRAPAIPSEVRDVLAWLAHLLDATVPLRTAEDSDAFARRHLGGPPRTSGAGGVVAVRETLGPVSAPLTARAFAGDLRRHPARETAALDSDENPTWDRLRLEGGTETVPSSLVAAFAPHTLAAAPLVVEINTRWANKEIVVHARPEDVAAAETYLRDLLARARGPENYLRGRCLQVVGTGHSVEIRHIPGPAASRDDVVVPEAVWAELDLNLGAIGVRRGLLRDLGLGTNRGVLLHGPPGTGKSAVCRIVAAELVGTATVLFCDALAVARQLTRVYAEVTRLAPALVVLEDIDLLVRRRGPHEDLGLHEFLAALDGVMSRHQDVVTLATTNDPSALDPAALRAARFDRLVEVPLPDAGARAAILRRYLGPLAGKVALQAVAGATAGASGADLRELVRRGVLAAGADVDTAALVRLARERDHAEVETGLYL